MFALLRWSLFAALLMPTMLLAAETKDDRVYEMRVYYANPGKLDALHARFRNHTLKLFEKHGMTNVGYFTPVGENSERKLIYWLSYPSRQAREASWKAFIADEEWKQAKAESEKDGVLVGKVESNFLATTDYSPNQLASSSAPRVFELRTYTTPAGRLPNLDARFRDHTVGLFGKHGMTNVIYWHLLPDQKGAETTLVYLLAHKSVDAAKESFGAFRQDPAWIAARTASEEKAGGSLTVDGGVQSLFLEATDYSPLK
jgi:hypothetical protein